MKSTTFSFAAALLATSTIAGNTEDWKKRSIYQVLTDRFARSDGSKQGCDDLSQYCGGNYKGMIDHLDYIQGMGFDAIWITPIVKNMEPGYHGYWATNWEDVNEHFGSKQDIHDLVEACHNRNIWVMLDVVANHVAPIGTDYSKVYPLNHPEHYHNPCDIKDWNNQWQVENCRLAGLADINQENDWVRGYLKDWVRNIVQEYNFDGIRIDTIPEVPKDFWSEYSASAGVFQMGECFNGDPAYVGPYQQHVDGLFNYPMYYTIRNVFRNQESMYQIRNRWNEEASHFKDIDALGLFVDNHDNARFLNQMGDHTKFSSAIVFALTGRGIPFTYYGSEQYFGGGNDPANREPLWTKMDTSTDLYQKIAKVHAARKAGAIWDHAYVERYMADDFFAFSRGKFLVALTNRSSGTISNKVTYHPFDEGERVCNIFNSGDCQNVSGGVNVTLVNGEQKIYVPAGQVEAELTPLQ